MSIDRAIREIVERISLLEANEAGFDQRHI
jgi:hypothetical protein